ncbi:MAG: SMP-30/gluconolactonase/LRE family protein [Opitutus sp.]|nr:SMP-30/gluconolactonase/LRE family protein [Opitutus sp.]
MKIKLALLLALTSSCLFAADDPPHPFVGVIERLDPAFDNLLAPGATIEKLAEGFRWSEGPTWYDGGVVFSDVLANTAYRWKPGASVGKVTGADIFLRPSGLWQATPGFREPGSNGLTRDAQGRLLLAQHGERQIARFDQGVFTTLARRFDGKRFNSPNDLAVRKNGDIYFTDPPYGLEKVVDSPLRELPYAGVFRLATDGKVTLLTKNLTFPNGIGFSPDEKTLYVAVSDSKATRVVAFDVQADGTLANERLFFDAQARKDKGGKGLCDGLKVDREGNVWATGPGGVMVISPAGKLLGVINTNEPTGNCCWGDDGSTLYITANYFLVRVKTLTKGAGW